MTADSIYRWYGREQRWEHLPSQMDSTQTWSLVQSPHDDNVVLAGTREPRLFRSEDAGRTWTALDINFATACPAVEVPRVTQIVFDPRDPNLVWVGVEIDGVWRSEDGGKTFEKHIRGLDTEDIHGLEVIYQDGQRWVFAVTNRGLFTSQDAGQTWTPRPFDAPTPYSRAIIGSTACGA